MANTAKMTNMTNTMNIFKNLYRGAATLLAACAFAGNVYADDPVINIGGDVYGGGKQGAVGTANVTAGIVRYTAEEAATENAKHLVEDANGKNKTDERGNKRPTHERLLKAERSLLKLIKENTMFTYLDDELQTEFKTPSTNNRIEGGINSRLREMLIFPVTRLA